MRRALALVLVLAGCSGTVSVHSHPSNPTPTPTPSATPGADAEHRLYDALVKGFGKPPSRQDAVDSIDMARALCTLNRHNFHVYALNSTTVRPLSRYYRRLDDMFRISVRYLCPERERELPPLKGESTGA